MIEKKSTLIQFVLFLRQVWRRGWSRESEDCVTVWVQHSTASSSTCSTWSSVKWTPQRAQRRVSNPTWPTLQMRWVIRIKKSLCITKRAPTHKSLSIRASSECHHPRPSLPVWSVLSVVVPAGCPLHPRAQCPQPAARQLQEAQQRRTEPLTQFAGRTLRGQGSSTGGQQRITPLTRGTGNGPQTPLQSPPQPPQTHTCSAPLHKMASTSSLVPSQNELWELVQILQVRNWANRELTLALMNRKWS